MRGHLCRRAHAHTRAFTHLKMGTSEASGKSGRSTNTRYAQLERLREKWDKVRVTQVQVGGSL